jgi:DNA primase
VSGRTEIDRALLAIPAAEYVRVLSGASPDRAGKIHCPFHDDETASLQLYSDGSWYCFGACKAGGSIFDFASRVFGLETKGRVFLELRARLADELGIIAI